MNDSPETATPRADFLGEYRLAVYRAEGRLDADLAAWLLDFVLGLEDADPEPFNRLLDLTGVAEIRLSGAELYRIARERHALTAGRPAFRTAIIATTPIAYGTARIYESLLAGSAIQVGVFRDAGGAAEWVGVPRSVVAPPAA